VQRLASRVLRVTRRELRAQLEASALCDHAGFTRELEAAYRSMWRSACAAAELLPGK
jgi:predicted O-linked N-acetylglucosamine transferase (SPINDLY family)